MLYKHLRYSEILHGWFGAWFPTLRESLLSPFGTVKQYSWTPLFLKMRRINFTETSVVKYHPTRHKIPE
jgi:hypothetical protein